MIEKFKSGVKSAFSLDRVICRLIAAFCTYVALTLLQSPQFASVKDGMDRSLGEGILWCAIFFLVYSTVAALLSEFPTDSWWLTLAATGCAYLWIENYPSNSNRFFVVLAILAVYFLFVLYAVRENADLISKWNPDGKTVAIYAACIAIVACVILSVITCLRYKTFSAPNYDFGLFCNMFANMKKTGLPLITSERDQLLSHFAVHISPIFYILLPFYYIFPSPLTLQIGQAVILMAGVIPVVLLARHFKLSGRATLLAALIYSFYPVLSTGCFYDIHENCFLPFFLLWTFYFFEKEKMLPMYLSALCVLAVKEDAAIYLLIFAVYILISRKEYLHGAILAGVSVGYFLLATHLINTYGDGVLSNRFDNLIADKESGLGGIVKLVFNNPGYLLTQLFTSAQGGWEKIYYFLMMFLPLGFLPFCTGKASRWLLLAPILMNLLSHYQYLYDPGFQYHFGVLAFLMYAMVQNIGELQMPTRRVLMSMAAVACCGLYLFSVTPKLTYYTQRWKDDRETYVKMEEILEALPEDASLNVSTFLLAHVADHDVVYEVAYHKNRADVDFVVLDKRYAHEEVYLAYLEQGYTVYEDHPGMILILQKGT